MRNVFWEKEGLKDGSAVLVWRSNTGPGGQGLTWVPGGGPQFAVLEKWSYQ